MPHKETKIHHFTEEWRRNEYASPIIKQTASVKATKMRPRQVIE